ncbi:MAG: endo-1,4-beta-xylanase [Rhodoferax sp.]|nr:endo-1,4-beta-xylanase [Rhodoferax sp.]
MSFDRRDFLTALAGGMVALTNAEAANLEGCGQGDGPSDPDSLARAGALRGIVVGAAVSSEQFIDTSYRAVLLQDCAALVPEWQMKWTATRKAPNTFDFAGMDLIARFASDHCLGLRGHLSSGMANAAGQSRKYWQVAPSGIWNPYPRHRWPIQKPDNFVGCRQPSHQARRWNRRRAAQHTLVSRTKHGLHRQCVSPGKTNGPERTAGLQRLQHGSTSRKAQAILALVLSLRDKGVPIDAVGLQSHLWATKRPLRTDALKNFCRTLVRNGVDVLITELDVRETDFNLTAAQRDKNSAAVVKTYLETVFAEVIPKELTLWGLSDRYSWLRKPKFNPENPLGYINGGLAYSEEMARQQMRQVLLDAIQSVPIQYKKKATYHEEKYRLFVRCAPCHNTTNRAKWWRARTRVGRNQCLSTPWLANQTFYIRGPSRL